MTAQTNRAQQKSQSTLTIERNEQAPRCQRTQSSHSTGSSRRNRSETYEDNEDLGNSERSRTPKIPCTKDIADLVQERLNQTSQQFPKGMEYNEIRLTDSSLSKRIITLCFPKKFAMPTLDHKSGISDPLLHLC